MITLENLRVFYGRKETIHSVSLEIPTGITAIVGKNGSGKSTLLRALSGSLPCRGRCLVEGDALAAMTANERAKRIAYMPQSLRAPHVSVETLISYGRAPYLSLGARLREEDREMVERAIKRSSLEGLRHRYLDEISGGELRRAYLGMILAQNTPILLLDEANASLDIGRVRDFYVVLRLLAEEGRTVIAVMHDLSDAVRYADRIVLMNEGDVLAFGDTEDLLKSGVLEDHFGIRRYETVDDGETRIFFA